MKDFPTPRNLKNIKQFLGPARYYRCFIPNFSKVAEPLTELLKKNRQFIWADAQARSFQHLRNALCNEPILQYPDYTKTFLLTTDASGIAVGGILSQGPANKDLPIAYTSRLLNSAEQNYSTIEKELLAIVYCMQHFRPYLYEKKFQLITDHKPLVWLHSVKDPMSRLVRWRLKLLEYEYDVIYKAGKTNLNPDALSRNPTAQQMLPLSLGLDDSDSDESLFSYHAPTPAARPSQPTPAEEETPREPGPTNATDEADDSDRDVPDHHNNPVTIRENFLNRRPSNLHDTDRATM